MINLLKASFVRVKKDLSLKIVAIVIVVFSFVMGAVYKSIGDFVNEMGAGDTGLITGYVIFKNSFGLSQNIGLVLTIILCLFICKDFSYQTIRNKLILGYSRFEVYLSSLITTLIVGLFLQLIYSLLSLAFGCLFVGYGSVFNVTAILKVLKTLLLGLLIYSVAFSMIIFLAFSFKKSASTLIIYIVYIIVITLIISVVSLLSTKYNWIDNLLKIFMTQQISLLDSSKDIWWIIISSIVKIGLFNGLGILIFSKSDLK